MKEYSGKNIKNVAVLGHTGAGKSEVLESMLFNTKVTDRFGKAVDGNSIIDYDSEEIQSFQSNGRITRSTLLILQALWILPVSRLQPLLYAMLL